jgi:hypothetical protein
MYTHETPRIVDRQKEIYQNLVHERGDNFFYYMNMLNLEKDEDPLILSAIHHYYYDYNELKNIKTIIQIKDLNSVSDIKKFLGNVSQVLTSNTNFIGCFKDNEIHKGNLLNSSRTINWIFNKLNFKVEHYLSRKKVIDLLTKYDLSIVDITEFDNLTYFYAKRKIIC